MLENTVNDYNDGSVADSLSLTIAKSVYNNLGYDADDLVKYNQRPIVTVGDPTAPDNAQRARTAEYLNYYFYGEEMSEETDEWLNTDPYNLKVSNNKTETPYDYYWGGFSTITSGTGGVDSRDGWLLPYEFPTVTPPVESEGAFLLKRNPFPPRPRFPLNSPADSESPSSSDDGKGSEHRRGSPVCRDGAARRQCGRHASCPE